MAKAYHMLGFIVKHICSILLKRRPRGCREVVHPVKHSHHRLQRLHKDLCLSYRSPTAGGSLHELPNFRGFMGLQVPVSLCLPSQFLLVL